MISSLKRALSALICLCLVLPTWAQKSFKPVIDFQYDYAFSFTKNGLACVHKNGNYGYIDQTGKTIIDFKFQTADGFRDNDIAIASGTGWWSLISPSGSTVTSFYGDFNAIIYDANFNIWPIAIGGKWGYMDKSGNVVIPCQYEYTSTFGTNGLAKVQKNGKWGYIDITGKVVIPFKFEYAYDFDNDLALVVKNDKYGFINRNGKTVIDFLYDDCKYFADNGFAQVKKDGKTGYIDKTGKLFYDEVYLFTDNGLARARKGDKWGFIKKNGKEAIDFQFDNVGAFASNGLAPAMKAGKWGFIDQNGKVVIDFQYDGVTGFSQNGLAGVNKGGKRGYIDKTGKMVISNPQFEVVGTFTNDNWAFVKKNGKWTYIDQTGKEITGYQFDEILTSYANEYAKIKKDGKIGFIDPTGKILIKCQFDDVTYFTKGYCPVKKGKKWGFIDQDGNLVVNYQFDNVLGYSPSSGLIIAQKNGKWGAIKQVNPKDDIEKYVKSEIEKWQQKGKYESSEAYLARVNEANGRKKVEDLVYSATQNLAPSYCDWKSITNDYDADNQTFKVDIGGLPSIYVKVPVEEAEAFDTSATKLQFSDVQYAMDSEGNFFLQKAKITNPVNSKEYSYSSTDVATFASTKLNINFDPAKFNVQSSDKTQTVNTEDKTLNVGLSEVDVNIPLNPQTNDKTFAVIIANENYQKEVKVKFASNDGKVFKEYCEKTLGIPAQNIHFVTDATFGNMKSEIKWITDVIAAYKGQAKVIFYYAGHGMPNESDKSAYLLPVDGFSSDFETAIKLNDLYSRLTESPSQSVTFILDACFSGSTRENGMLAEARGVKVRPKTEVLSGNSIVFSAATGDETAYPFSTKQHGLFTYFLLKKLQETKGDVTYKDLIEYIKTNVEQQSVVVNQKSQTPQVQASQSLQGWETLKLK